MPESLGLRKIACNTISNTYRATPSIINQLDKEKRGVALRIKRVTPIFWHISSSYDRDREGLKPFRTANKMKYNAHTHTNYYVCIYLALTN